MKKIVRICKKDYMMKSSAYTQFAYKDATGRSLLKDLQSLEGKDLSNPMDILDDIQDMLFKMAFVMIEEADEPNRPMNYNDFLKSLEDGLFDDFQWINDIVELAASPLSTGIIKKS